jgi:hypothetical protein
MKRKTVYILNRKILFIELYLLPCYFFSIFNKVNSRTFFKDGVIFLIFKLFKKVEITSIKLFLSKEYELLTINQSLFIQYVSSFKCTISGIVHYLVRRQLNDSSNCLHLNHAPKTPMGSTIPLVMSSILPIFFPGCPHWNSSLH